MSIHRQCNATVALSIDLDLTATLFNGKAPSKKHTKSNKAPDKFRSINFNSHGVDTTAPGRHHCLHYLKAERVVSLAPS